MKKINTVRALRDPRYRSSLSPAQKAMLPNHPSGASALSDNVLQSVTGGCGWTGCNSPCDPNQPTGIIWSCATAQQQCP